MSLSNASQAQKMLLSLPDAMIQEVRGAERKVAYADEIEIVQCAGPGTNGNAVRIQSPDGLTFFHLDPDTPGLKAADKVYSFTPETGDKVVYVVALATGAHDDLVKAWELILVQCCALGAVEGVQLLPSEDEIADVTSKSGIQVGHLIG